MSFPFRSGLKPATFTRLVEHLRAVFERFPDRRPGENTVYAVADAAISAFSVFFTQSPSFLDFQRALQLAKGCNNAQTLFRMTQIPSDNQTRNLLDQVPPQAVFPVFSAAVEELHRLGHLEPYRAVNGDLLAALDGTQYFASANIHCPKCHVQRHRNGTTTYSHSAITPVLVAPGNPRVLPLEPEFVTPQDGHDKQDCENAAAKRWLSQYAERYGPWGVTILGDDLYCKQPLCEAILQGQLNFILVCKPNSHPILYEWVAGLAANAAVQTRCCSSQ